MNRALMNAIDRLLAVARESQERRRPYGTRGAEPKLAATTEEKR